MVIGTDLCLNQEIVFGAMMEGGGLFVAEVTDFHKTNHINKWTTEKLFLDAEY